MRRVREEKELRYNESMIPENALVIYKAKPAIVKERNSEKYTITLEDGSQVKVRDKDIEQIHPGPVKSFSELAPENAAKSAEPAVREAWELLLDEGHPLTLKDLSGFIFNEYTPSSAYAAYRVLCDGLYFSGAVSAITLRSKDEIAANEAKRNEKQRETGERNDFLERIKKCIKNPSFNLVPNEDARFLQDVEALALGKSIKSRTMKDLGLSETPEDAHALLLKTGFWSPMINPQPARFRLSLNSANIPPEPPFSLQSNGAASSGEERRNLCHLAAFAIDSPWSNDPDDAVSIEADETGKNILYVHVADPAASIAFDSPAEKEARDRGATLYLPETTVRMLSEEFLPVFALGLSAQSPALTFKITLDEDSKIIDTEIFPSIVKVKRLTYEEADKLMEEENSAYGAVLRELNELAMRILKRRTEQGAINIELPDVHICVVPNGVENGEVKIQPHTRYKSAVMVRECMITAGEAAGAWASGKGLPFPYLSQEAELPETKVPDGMAGSYQLRRCMRPRILSTKPGRHQGLGLDVYTQVTSPLRRYTDLLAHIQIRAFLRGDKTLSADEISAHLGFSEAAATAAAAAERATDQHWIMVYLSDKKDTVWEAVALEKKGNRWAVIIPALGLETQVPLQKDVSPNEIVKLVLKSVNIPKREAVFVQE